MYQHRVMVSGVTKMDKCGRERWSGDHSLAEDGPQTRDEDFRNHGQRSIMFW